MNMKNHVRALLEAIHVYTIAKLVAMLTRLTRYEAKIAKICNFWTFRPVIQLKRIFSKSDKKPFCPMLHRCTFYIYGALGKHGFCLILTRLFISRITDQNVDFCYFCIIPSNYP